MPVGGIPLFAKPLKQQGFDSQTIELIMNAWRPSTKKSYTTYLNKWMVFCVERNINCFQPSLPQACKFLRMLSDNGLGYGALNTARSALSTILPKFGAESFGKHPMVCWLLKGAYEKCPPQPRYVEFWNINKVFDLFKSWGRNKFLSLKLLTLKLSVLLLLVTSQRGQTVINLDITDMIVQDDTIVLKMKCLLKHNRVGDPLDVLVLKDFPDCKRLCVVHTLKCYLARTQFHRSYSKLLLSYVRPFAPISRDTLARWTLLIMQLAGLDISKYKSHSTRGASASAARRLGVPLNLIMKRASWKSVQSFAKFYDKQIEQDENEVTNALLHNAM